MSQYKQSDRDAYSATTKSKTRPQSASHSLLNNANHRSDSFRESRSSNRLIVDALEKVKQAGMYESAGKATVGNKSNLEEQRTRTIWRAFGSYIAKQLTSGRGVDVPRFGQFTFTATEVSLAGTTNPTNRDKQWREPIFMVGKDFVSATSIQTGISCQHGTQIRPHAIQGISGIIPKVKINYVEVGLFCGYEKDECRLACEQVVRKLSDRVRNGENVTKEIPLVGRFIVRNNIAAIDFNSDLVEASRGTTAKQQTVGNLFANSNAVLNLNNALQEKAAKVQNQSGTLEVRNDASAWLKGNLNIDIDSLADDSTKLSQRRMMSAKVGRRNVINKSSQARREMPLTLSQTYLSDLDGGRTKQLSQISRAGSNVTHTTAMASHMSKLPNVDNFTLLSFAEEIFKFRKRVCDFVQQSKYTLRDILTSTQIHSILKQNGIYIEIQQLKALLRELGFQFNGPAASFTLLFSACKAYIHGISGGYTNGHGLRSSASVSEFSSISKPKFNLDAAEQTKLLGMIRDLFYSSNLNMYELFREGATHGGLDLEGLIKVINIASGGTVSYNDVERVFKSLRKNKNGKISFQTFEEAFKSEVPTNAEFETKVIRQVRQWMYENKLSSEMAFDTLCRSAGRFIERTMSRAAFHKACITCDVGLSAAQVDSLFVALSAGAGQDLDLHSWQARIYEDGDSPLQMIREVVLQNNLTQDDLLFQMKLRVWSDPLNQDQFYKALRSLDQTISDSQLRALFVQLRNQEGKVDVPEIVRNFTGQQFETVDYRNKVFKQLYYEIFPHKEEELIALLQEQDSGNLGLVNEMGLLSALKQVVQSVAVNDLERFVRHLEKDKLGKLNYMEFVQKMCKISNRNHNPFKSLVTRLQFFLKQNEITAAGLLKRLALAGEHQVAGPGIIGIPLRVFAEFLKQKVEKKKDISELEKYATMIDIDKDGFITEADVMTCIKNLNNAAFYRNGGKALQTSTFNASTKFYPNSSKMSKDKALEVCKQIREVIGQKKLQFREVFDLFDLDKDNMVSYAELSRGLDSILTLAQPIKEQLFALMDKSSIGLINYSQFLDVLRLDHIEKQALEDNFDWENGVIQQIKQWIVRQGITTEEAFKCFDRDFDGFISKEDLRYSLSEILEINPSIIQPTKLDRLYKLLDFFKTGLIQMSDFQRLLSDENPYALAGAGTKMILSKSMGGGLSKASTFDWKFSAIQQIGLTMSKKFASLDDSFADASVGNGKITFEHFKQFIDREGCLQGLNLTLPLLQKLFSELDPHKKGFININDWKNAFKSFNWNEQIFIEFKNVLTSTFTDCDSVFQFLTTFGQNQIRQQLSKKTFESAVESLTGGRFKKVEIDNLWKQITGNSSSAVVEYYQFKKHFEDLNYRGLSSVKSLASQSGLKSASSNQATSRFTIQTKTTSSSQWESNIFEKLRVLMTSAPKSLEDVFSEFDTDGNGFVTPVEFRNAIRKLGLGLTSRDIDAILAKIDSNADGRIDYCEFMNKFKTSALDERMKQRTASKMSKLKQLMSLHMTSANDAFKFFDTMKTGGLTFLDFSKLVTKVHEMAHEKSPTYLVIKDIFDTIDIRKDGLIDLQEWQQSFDRVSDDPSSAVTSAQSWENSKEFEKIGALIAKNRKLLSERFKSVLGASSIFTFEQGKQAMDQWLFSHFSSMLTDGQLRCIFKAAQVPAKSQTCLKYDYLRLLDIYKLRHSGPQV